MYEYEAGVAPSVGDILDWTADSGGPDVYRVVQVRHRLANLRDQGIQLVGLMVVVSVVAPDEAYAVTD